MNIYKNIYSTLSGVCLLLTMITAISCDNANDWTVDPAHNRLFSCDLSGVTPEDIGTEATLEFKTVKGAEYYIIEVSKDTLYNDVAMGSSASSIVYGEDKSIKKSPYTMTDLDSSTKYYIRLKAMSSSTPESKWSYLSNYSFKTKSEQIFEGIPTADITESTVTLHWLANTEVTKLEILKGEEVKVTKDLTTNSEAVTNGTIVIDGLDAQTSYTAKIYKDNIVRGTISFTTFAAVPGADFVYRMTATESLSNELLTNITAQCDANSSITIAIPAGTTHKYGETLVLPEGFSYTFFGIAGEKKPVIAVTKIELTNSAQIKFQNIELNANGIDENGAEKTNSYLINQSNSAIVDNIVFEDCDIIGYGPSGTLLRLQTAATKEIKNLSFVGCYIKTTVSGYYMLQAKDGGKFGNILFSNTTISGSGTKGLILSDKTPVNSITIEDCTIYKAPYASQYIIDFTDRAIGTTEGISIKNTIFAASTGTKGLRGKNDNVSIENVWFTSDFTQTSDKLTGIQTTAVSSTDLFEDPDNDNFNIKSYNFDGRLSAGAKKWRMTE